MPRSHGEVKQVNGKRVASPEYMSWQMMKNRCLNPRATDYAYYGGRGISIAARWMRFEEFLADMGRKPTLLHTLERRNNSKHYEKRNCYWATRTEQARNRRSLRFSTKEVRFIRAAYATGKYRQKDIGALFGVHQSHISQITRSATWV